MHGCAQWRNWLSAPPTPGILLHYALRKRCIARLARATLNAGASQVVIIGAGFDALSLELQREFPEAEFWEIDHPATQQEKARAFAKTEKLPHFLPIDLSAAGIDGTTLAASGFYPAQRTFWVPEGLLMYLRAEIVRSLMTTLHSLSAPGRRFAFTFMEKQSNGSIRFRRQSRLVEWWLRRRGEPFLWGATRNEMAELARPWRNAQFFDHNDLRAIEPTLADKPLAEGELICLAEF